MNSWRENGSVFLTLAPSTEIIDRDVAPAENLEPLLAGGLPPDALDLLAQNRLARHEQKGRGIVAGVGQAEAKPLGLGREAVRDLDQDAAAIAGLGIGADGAAMLEISQDVEPCSSTRWLFSLWMLA